MPSRRRLLTSLGCGTMAGLAGCSGSNSGGSDTVDCHSHALSHGDGDALDNGARGTVEDDTVRLVVPLSVEDVKRYDIDTIRVYDIADELAHSIPVSADDADLMANKVGVNEGQLQYEQHLGHRPFHGQYRVVVVDTNEKAVDSVTIEFNCFPEVEDEA
ncbi:hypothetical protein [Haladaptatus caseinilyticus]|uniref:hypothetical protein n=1 Tax=Haladaptatus caseinilyticus TaxID=2993314 RepID=UPI00224AFB7D|nr:hypothetical protein [Haladaptatus caseinilyticus]